MKMDCEVIRDLMPLYADEACSDNSRSIVEEHLQECSACREMLERLKKTEIDTCLQNEKDTVIQDGARRFRQRSTAVGSVIAGFFMIPILACLIINIFSGSPLGAFLIVLASLLVAASLIIVPLMVPEDRAFWTFCAFCTSLVLLLAVICMYVRGSWFWIASSAVLFGLAVVFLPFVVRARPARRLIGSSNPVLIVLGLDAALFVNMMNMITSRGKITINSILFTFGMIAGIGLVVTEIIRKRGTKE